MHTAQKLTNIPLVMVLTDLDDMWWFLWWSDSKCLCLMSATCAQAVTFLRQEKFYHPVLEASRSAEVAEADLPGVADPVANAPAKKRRRVVSLALPQHLADLLDLSEAEPLSNRVDTLRHVLEHVQTVTHLPPAPSTRPSFFYVSNSHNFWQVSEQVLAVYAEHCWFPFAGGSGSCAARACATYLLALRYVGLVTHHRVTTRWRHCTRSATACCSCLSAPERCSVIFKYTRSYCAAGYCCRSHGSCLEHLILVRVPHTSAALALPPLASEGTLTGLLH
eukprot:TRINITY_DN1711_c0_g1_i1.p1 TRINITY_DN1711_c0_g1~~TRINITY_DN1711_c0_g1_i1.p1  ORF type:complete len:278 (+),score=37.40 TRINITY_DN1711_c0_g1_i1:317-1150(+)